MTSLTSQPMAAPGDTTVGARAATVAVALGIAGLLVGFLMLPLLASVVAITMGSLGLQAVSEGRADPAVRRRLHTAIWFGVAGLGLWIPVGVVAAIVSSGNA